MNLFFSDVYRSVTFFPRDVLDEILNLIESVSEGLPFLLLHWVASKVLHEPLCDSYTFHATQCSIYLITLRKNEIRSLNIVDNYDCNDKNKKKRKKNQHYNFFNFWFYTYN